MLRAPWSLHFDMSPNMCLPGQASTSVFKRWAPLSEICWPCNVLFPSGPPGAQLPNTPFVRHVDGAKGTSLGQRSFVIDRRGIVDPGKRLA